ISGNCRILPARCPRHGGALQNLEGKVGRDQVMQTPDARRQTPDAPVLVCFALKEEAAPFGKIAADRSGISVLITGIGRQNAEKSVREFLAGGASAPASQLVSSLAPPKLVLTCGFAGGLNPDLKPGDVVFEVPFSSSSRGNEAQFESGEKLEPIYI